MAVAEKEPLGSGPKRALGTLAAEDDVPSGYVKIAIENGD